MRVRGLTVVAAVVTTVVAAVVTAVVAAVVVAAVAASATNGELIAAIAS